MRTIVRSAVALGFFILAAAFDGTILYYVFAGIGFLVGSSAFRQPERSPATESEELSIFQLQAIEQADREKESDHSSSEGDLIEPLNGASEAVTPSSTEELGFEEISDGDFVDLSRLESETLASPNATSRQFPWRLVASIGLISALIVIGIRSISRLKDVQPGDPAPAVDRWLPEYWDQSACLESRYPVLRIGPEIFPDEIISSAGWQRGEYTAGLSCAYDWDDAEISEQVEVLRSHGLLMNQWNAEVLAQVRQMLESGEQLPVDVASITGAEIPDDLHDVSGDTHFANLSRLMEGLAVAVAEPHLPPPVPDVATRAKARAELKTSDTLLPRRPGARRILIHKENPTIYLYTDMPDTMTLADLGSEAAVIMGGAFAGFHKNIDILKSEGLPTLALAPDLFSRYLTAQLGAIVTNELRLRPAGLRPLPDLDIIYLRRPAPPQIIGNGVKRTGVYRGDLGVVYVQRKFSVSYSEGINSVMSIVSTDLLHEMTHYFRDSVYNQDLPFLLEGQATFEGQEGMRPILAGARASSEFSLSEVLTNLDLSPAEFQAFSDRRLAAEGMSDSQRRILCHISTLIRDKRFSLERMLTISHTRLARMDDNFHRDFYSAAWAAYGTLKQDNDWPPRFREIATQVIKGDISPEVRAEINSLEDRVVSWVHDLERKENPACQK